MTTPKNDPVDLRLHVMFEDPHYNRNSWDGSRFAHVYVTPVVIARGKFGDRRCEAFQVDSYEIDVPDSVRALKGLKIRAQMDESSAARGEDGWYGYRLAFACEELTLAESDRIAPVLRRLSKRMEATADQFGYPRTLVQFLSHLVNALGLKGQPFARSVGTDDDYEGTGQRSMNVESLRYWLDDRAKDWRAKYGIETADADA